MHSIRATKAEGFDAIGSNKEKEEHKKKLEEEISAIDKKEESKAE